MRKILIGFLLAVSLPAAAIIGGGILIHNHTSTSSGGVLGAASGASMVLIQRQAVTSVSQVDFTSGIDSTYDEYILKVDSLVGVGACIGGGWFIRVSEDGGSSFKSGASDYAWTSFGHADNNPGVTSTQGTAADAFDTNIPFVPFAAPGVSSTGPNAGEIKFYMPATSGLAHVFLVSFVGWNPVPPAVNTHIWMVNGSGVYRGTTNAINAIRGFCGSGGTFTGTFALYGIRKT